MYDKLWQKNRKNTLKKKKTMREKKKAEKRSETNIVED